MLTEFALTPQTFQVCQSTEKDWILQIRSLNRRLVACGNQCPLIFANLNQHPKRETWRARIAKSIAKLPQRYRPDLENLLKLLDGHLVDRPSCAHIHDPNDELHWVREVAQANPDFPIHHLVVTFEKRAAADKIRSGCISINHLDQEPLWATVSTSAFPSMEISAQIEQLCPLWLHGEVLALVLPYGLDNEAPWFFAFVKAAIARPSEFNVPVIELHVSFDGNGADLMSQQLSHPTILDFLTQARQHLPRGTQFTLHVRPRSHGRQRFISRRLFVIKPADVGTGTPAPSVRWGVAFEHVASPKDTPHQTFPAFTLLPRSHAATQHAYECVHAHRLLGPEIITV